MFKIDVPNVNELYVAQMRKDLLGWNTFVTYVGLARGYTALGDKKDAIANWEIGIRNIPESQKQNLALYQRALDALKGRQADAHAPVV